MPTPYSPIKAASEFVNLLSPLSRTRPAARLSGHMPHHPSHTAHECAISANSIVHDKGRIETKFTTAAMHAGRIAAHECENMYVCRRENI